MNAKMKAILNVVIVAVVSVALLFGMSAITDTLVKRQEDEAAKIAFGDILNLSLIHIFFFMKSPPH